MTIKDRLGKYSKKKYFKYQIIYMIFVSNMPMLSPHIVFNILFDLMYDMCYPFHVKTTLFCFYTCYC